MIEFSNKFTIMNWPFILQGQLIFIWKNAYLAVKCEAAMLNYLPIFFSMYHKMSSKLVSYVITFLIVGPNSINANWNIIFYELITLTWSISNIETLNL